MYHINVHSGNYGEKYRTLLFSQFFSKSKTTFKNSLLKNEGEIKIFLDKQIDRICC